MQKISSLSSLNHFPSQSIAVVANDTGGSLYISSLLNQYFSKLKFSISGPAIEIFKSRWPKLENLDINECLNDTELLITGTSQSHINKEHQARIKAKQFGIKSITVLDHWTDYKARFIRNENEVLPDQIWVADKKAEELARKTFPNLHIQRFEINLYSEIIERTNYFHNTFFKERNNPPKKILYFTEPIEEIWRGGNEIGEYQALEYWINSLPKLSGKRIISSLKNIEEVRIRPHPSESLEKYKRFEIMLREKNINSTIDKNNSIEYDLAWSDATFGCNTQALVFSIRCNIPTYCSLPPWAPECCLSEQSLIMIKDI